MRKPNASLASAVVVILGVLCPSSIPLGAGEPRPGAGTVVLDLKKGSFRGFARWRTPSVVSKDGKVSVMPKPTRKGQKNAPRESLPVVCSPTPPQGWARPDFDDVKWFRARGAVLVPQNLIHGGVPTRITDAGRLGLIYYPGNPTEWQLVCLRGKFRVEDPGQVKGLRLLLRYHGGAVVYVNGRELARAHLPAGPLDFEKLAEKYPDEAYVRPDGKLYAPKSDLQKFAERMKVRVRGLPGESAPEGVLIPGTMLRKGLNVIAVAVHAAPLSELVLTAKRAKERRALGMPWAHAAILDARLTAGSATGLVPGVAPAGIAIANSSPIETLTAWDYALPSEGLRPIRLVGAQNGSFSGRVVLSSAGPIKGLKASATALTAEGGKGKIPASAVQVRWAEPGRPEVSFAGTERFDRLLPQLPAEVALPEFRKHKDWVKNWAPLGTSLPSQASWVTIQGPVVAPVWVTVRVPAGAPAGEYKGTLTIEARGSVQARFSVPLELKVHGWRLPDPKDFVTHHHFFQSPDTLAQYCKVPLWSEKHWKLVARSLKVLSGVGNKICALHLAVKVPSLNNSESMVRWVKKPGGGYDYDFSIAEKYMDAYEKTCGKPRVLVLNPWGSFGKNRDSPAPVIKVTVVDPSGKKLEDLPQPPYGTPENQAFWKPVLLELRKRLQKRGWLDVAAAGYISYAGQPTRKMVDVFRNIWPDGQWMNCCHVNAKSYRATKGSVPVRCTESVWGIGVLYDPEVDKGGKHRYASRPCPWKRGPERIVLGIPRFGGRAIVSLSDSRLFGRRSPLAAYRMISEAALQGDLQGLGRMGGDFWPLPIGRRGKSAPLCDHFAAVGPVSNTVSLTSPGPEGAIGNERLEMFREGLQITETIILLRRAMEAKKVPAALAAKINTLLDERARSYLRTRMGYDVLWKCFETSGWQERDDRLYALAAEVAKAAK